MKKVLIITVGIIVWTALVAIYALFDTSVISTTYHLLDTAVLVILSPVILILSFAIVFTIFWNRSKNSSLADHLRKSFRLRKSSD